MGITRRAFIGGSPLALAAACGPERPGARHVEARGGPSAIDAALEAAKRGGASYADVRVVRRRVEAISTREDHVTGVSFYESYGLGVRVLVSGAWGFAAAPEVTPA